MRSAYRNCGATSSRAGRRRAVACRSCGPCCTTSMRCSASTTSGCTCGWRSSVTPLRPCAFRRSSRWPAPPLWSGSSVGGGVAGLASGLIFAVIPSVSRYAQEARPYAFATFFAALATLMFLRAMERPRWSNWTIYAVVLAAAGAANLIAVCVAGGHLLVVLWDFCQRTVRVGGDGTAESGRKLPGGRLAPEGTPGLLVRRFFVSVIVGAVLVSPLVVAGHTQQGWQIGQQAVPHVAQLVGV